jgi:hypothetical protein
MIWNSLHQVILERGCDISMNKEVGVGIWFESTGDWQLT